MARKMTNLVGSGECFLLNDFVLFEDESPVYTGADSEWITLKAQGKTPSPHPTFQGKNPIMELNELYHGLTYTFKDPEGPIHAAMFEVSVEVEQVNYRGTANSKRAAKLDAAQLALQGLENTGMLTLRKQEMEQKREEKTAKRKEFLQQKSEVRTQRIEAYKNRDRKNPPLPKNAVMKLNDKHRGLDYRVISESGKNGQPWFTVVVVVQSETFSGSGNTKKRAKLEAAEQALRYLQLWTEEDMLIKENYLRELENKARKTKVADATEETGEEAEEAVMDEPLPSRSGEGDFNMEGGKAMELGGQNNLGAVGSEKQQQQKEQQQQDSYQGNTASSGRGKKWYNQNGDSDRGFSRGRGRGGYRGAHTNWQQGGLLHSGQLTGVSKLDTDYDDTNTSSSYQEGGWSGGYGGGQDFGGSQTEMGRHGGGAGAGGYDNYGSSNYAQMGGDYQDDGNYGAGYQQGNTESYGAGDTARW